ncbi:hypothetical protein BN946_scf185014.g33 [Trametes cinnabarina]|uniref:Mitochondrial mRNA-processing protein COX24 C-terminal domain-containing protein n=1 Tax=Pycnoporus cinnabarinus TaxID=5643 RepID=A0A060SMA8_PYCCI|nr:hypothetical protein BN946_scf185014.g33 [Trametes cinnabarina]
MSVLAHLLRPAAGARRAYSAFSKPGGGRFFVPAKHLKDAPSPSKTNVDSPNGESAASSVDESTAMSSGAPMTAEASPVPSTLSATPQYIPVHPRINAQDLKIHQFFSLHRPLLTISQPPSSLFESHSTIFPLSPSSSSEFSYPGNYEESADVSPEADADAARQLARAMVVNRIGASLAWEETLKRLGLDVTSGRAEEVSMAEAEFEMYMDSTKRKRRKKMKKHK